MTDTEVKIQSIDDFERYMVVLYKMLDNMAIMMNKIQNQLSAIELLASPVVASRTGTASPHTITSSTVVTPTLWPPSTGSPWVVGGATLGGLGSSESKYEYDKEPDWYKDSLKAFKKALDESYSEDKKS